MNRHRVVSITPALAGQDIDMIIVDLLSVEALFGSHRRHDHRAAAVALVSVVEQFCRLVVAEMLGRDKGTMPERVEVRLADMKRVARLTNEVLVSLTLNFQSVEAVERMLREYGMGDVLEREGLRAALAALFAARHDLVHTAAPVWLDVRAAYYAVVELVFGIATYVQELEADMRLVEGDFFRKSGMLGRSQEGYERAEPLCRALATNNPDSAQAHARLGLALSGLGRHEEALASYDRAAKIDPRRAVTHLDRALPLARLGRHEEALASCEKAIGIMKRDREDAGDGEDHAGREAAADSTTSAAHAHLVRADILAEMGRIKDALADCDQAVRLNGSLARAHLLRGNMLADMGHDSESLDAYDRSIELDRYDEDAYAHRADLLAKAGRAAEALAAYDAAIEVGPKHAEVRSRKGFLLATLGRYDDALCCFNRALALDPDHADALVYKGDMLALLGRGAEADESYKGRTAAAQYPEQGSTNPA